MKDMDIIVNSFLKCANFSLLMAFQARNVLVIFRKWNRGYRNNKHCVKGEDP